MIFHTVIPIDGSTEHRLFWKLKEYVYKTPNKWKIKFIALYKWLVFHYSPTDNLPGTSPAERSDKREWNQPSSALHTLQTAAWKRLSGKKPKSVLLFTARGKQEKNII